MQYVQNRQALIGTAVVSAHYKEKGFLEERPFRDTHAPKPGFYMDSKVGGSSETHVCAGSTSHLHDILNGFYSKEFAISPATIPEATVHACST
jgi:hypothetical protein